MRWSGPWNWDAELQRKKSPSENKTVRWSETWLLVNGWYSRYHRIPIVGSFFRLYTTYILPGNSLWPFRDGENVTLFNGCWWPPTIGDEKVTAWITWCWMCCHRYFNFGGWWSISQTLGIISHTMVVSRICYLYPYSGKIPILTHIFQGGLKPTTRKDEKWGRQF